MVDSNFTLLIQSHSQTLNIFHPNFRSLLSLRRSRNILSLSLLFQYPFLDLGVCPSIQVCPCQKHPLTCIAILEFAKTISGFPGKFWAWRVCLKPRLFKAFLTLISGLVSLARILLIKLDRFLAEKTSVTILPNSYELIEQCGMTIVGGQHRLQGVSDRIMCP